MGLHPLAQRLLHRLRWSRRIKLAESDGSHETALCQQASTLRLVHYRFVWDDDGGDAGLEQIGTAAVAGLADRRISARQPVEKGRAVCGLPRMFASAGSKASLSARATATRLISSSWSSRVL
jgi:hypothetical protein